MKRVLALAIAATSFAAAAQTSPGPAAPPRSDVLQKQECADCGEVRSVRRLERQQRPPAGTPERPSGLVATIPLDGSKATVGSSTRADRKAEPALVTFEVIVRMDDGRVRIVVMDEEPAGIKRGDRVRVEENRVVPR